MKFNFNTKTLIILIIIIITAMIGFFIFKNGDYQIYEVKNKDFQEILKVSGKVIPAQNVDLSFEASGKIRNFNLKVGDKVKAGDVIATIDDSEIRSQIKEKQTVLESNNAKLKEVIGEIDFNQVKSERNNLLNVFKKTYITSDDIIRNKVDLFFSEPESRFPEFNNSLSDYFIRKDLEGKRYKINSLLAEFKIKYESLDSETISSQDAQYAISSLKEIEQLLSIISSASTKFVTTDNKTQTQIDSYITGISTSRTEIASAIVEIGTTLESLRKVEAEIPVLESSIENAKSSINTLNVTLNKYKIVAPFSGIITAENIENGQFVSAGEIAVSLLSDLGLEVESFIPEVNIANINIGDNVSMIFDAFDADEKFYGSISHVDPSETLKDGITTYKILIEFKEKYENILPGMSVDIEIEKVKIENQIVIPKYLIIKENGVSFVDLLIEGKVSKTEIQTSKDDGKGNIIVVNGLKEGYKIIIPQK